MRIAAAKVVSTSVSPFLLVLLASDATAEVRLPAILSSRAVLQRDSVVAVWGFADAGEEVTVRGDLGEAIAGPPGFSRTVERDPKSGHWSFAFVAPSTGRFRFELKTGAAGGPFWIEVRGTTNAVRLDDLLVGEVWLCGGQSNMEWAFAYGGVRDAERERAAADDPHVRLFDVPNVLAAQPARDCEASWQPCTPDTVKGFSCVGWFFARELRRELGVPVGLIGVNWGGTVAEAWMRREALAPFSGLADALASVEAEARDPGASSRRIEAAWSGWWRELATRDLGIRNGWTEAGFDDSRWSEAKLPEAWDGALGGFDGIVWYRREVELPESLAGREHERAARPIDGMDQLFLDGVAIGGTEVHGRWEQPRRYRVPAQLATAGRHVLALRIADTGGGGGMTGEPGDFALRAAAGGPRLELAGTWRRRIGMEARDFPPWPRVASLHPNTASVLWNGMIAPIAPFCVRGALWYQGESNVGRAAEYAELFPALIADWRATFERAEMPFLFVQIAPFEYRASGASAELRQAQLEALRVANTGMVVTADIGDAHDIHPANKQEVGRRLALWALAKTYGKEVGGVSGPLYASQAVEGSAVRVRFTHAEGLAASPAGSDLVGFELRGTDGVWHPASATIDRDTVLVASDAVPAPQEARLGYADAFTLNLVNAAGLPASPFCRLTR